MKRLLGRLVLAAVLVGMSFSGVSQVQADILWDNGPLITHPGAGFGGADASAISPTGTIFGFGSQQTANNRMADDFTVATGGWNLDSLRLFTYQTNSTTASTITGVTLRIWDGVPGVGNIVWGDNTTNVLAGTGFTNIYRTTATTLTNAARPIMFADVNLGGLFLDAGNYYFDWSFSGTLASGPWQPPVSSATQMILGNGLQSLANGPYNPALDGTNQQELPFVLQGTSAIPEPTSMVVLMLGTVAFCFRRRH